MHNIDFVTADVIYLLSNVKRTFLQGDATDLKKQQNNKVLFQID